MSEQFPLLPITYAGTISYFKSFKDNDEVWIEKFENYVKGTHRNRCYIAGPDGVLMLSIPLKKGKNERTLIKDVRISYDHNWQHVHWESLCSAYRRSSYFEFYEDLFRPFYHKKFDLLFDFNMELLKVILDVLKLNTAIKFTDVYEKAPADKADFRNITGKNQSITEILPYMQVFENRNGFIPDLSIYDLIFNQGPQAKEHI